MRFVPKWFGPSVLSTALALAAAQPGLAVPYDVTNPGNPITPSSGNHPGGEAAPNAIDNLHTTKYLNFDKLNTGFTVTPSGGGIVRAISIMSANDAAERDPASYLLAGSNDGVNFTTIGSGKVGAFANRFLQQEILIPDNTQSFAQYRVTFPTVQNAAAANSMQVAEVQLLTKHDVTSPFDIVTGTSNNFPGAESPRQGIDNRPDTKYLNFDEVNTGLTITAIQGKSIVTGLSIRRANDAPERDPVNFTIEGSNDGVAFTQIGSGIIPVNATRFTQSELAEFANDQAFRTYRVRFPNVQNAAAANSMQIGEIELMGELVHKQVDMKLSTAFNADVILNTVGGVLDTTFGGGGVTGFDNGARQMLTQAAATQIGGANGTGLPDDGLIKSAALPFAVQLGYSNGDNGNNAIALLGGQQALYSLAGPEVGKYSSLVVFASNGDGDGNVAVTLNYGDGTSQVVNIVVDDWFNDGGELSGNNVFALIDGLDRTNGPGNGFENNNDPGIFGYQIVPTDGKDLVSINFNHISGGQTNIFGVSGMRDPTIPEPASALLGLLGVGALAARRRRMA